MCKFCEVGEDIEFTIEGRPVILRFDYPNVLNVRLPFPCGGGITKPIVINYCFVCGRKLEDHYEPIN